ncbi:MAG: cytochrome P450 [Actinobacteria bacterium]|nr:cytochrome P450 [Actinomycetota bacterium]
MTVETALTVPEEIARSVMLPESYADLDGTVHPACRWLRENLPVGRAEIDGYDPVWLIARHADIKTILGDQDLFHNADVNILLYPTAGEEGLRALNGGNTKVLENLSYMDPPEHATYRTAIAPVFSPARVRQFEARLKTLAKEHVDRFIEAEGDIDFVSELSRDYPLSAVMELAGIPPEDYQYMLRLTQDTFGGDDPDWKRDDVPESPEAAARQWHAAVQDFYEYFEGIRSDRTERPRLADMSTEIITSRTADGALMPDRIQNHLTLTLALAGHDTVNSAISGCMHGLLQFPDQFAKVKEDPSLIPGLVDEGLRWATPAKHFMRNASEDADVLGVEMNAMDRVMALFVSGNRDEEVFESPYDFDVTRKPNPHLSFSYGPHVCLGQHVAKLEMRTLYAELIPRLRTIEPAGEPTLKLSNFVSGQKTLPMRFVAA